VTEKRKKETAAKQQNIVSNFHRFQSQSISNIA